MHVQQPSIHLQFLTFVYIELAPHIEYFALSFFSVVQYSFIYIVIGIYFEENSARRLCIHKRLSIIWMQIMLFGHVIMSLTQIDWSKS